VNVATQQALHFRIEPTEADWITANWLILRHRWRPERLLLGYLAVWLFYAAIIIGSATLEYGWDSGWALYNLGQAALYSALVWGVIVILVVTLLPRRVRRQFAESRRLSAGADVVVDPQGVRYDTGIAKISLAWGQLKRWHENARVIAMVLTEREVLLLPKSLLDPATIETVRAHLVQAQVERGLT
jgi:hypothetical protein